MKRKLQEWFALSEQGAQDLIKGSLWCAAANISLMFPVGLLIVVLNQMMQSVYLGASPTAGLWRDLLLAVVLLSIIFVLHWFQYKSTYIAAYAESANQRVRLAEKLRRLPLSFFGKRDLADLTNTIMSDCSALETAFSHFMPELAGACLSTAVIAVGLFCLDGALALAALWVVPVALILAVGSKVYQDKMGQRLLQDKLAASDGIQECLETIRDIKACNQKKQQMAKLSAKLAQTERAAMRSELTTGVFMVSAQMILRIGLATTVLVGAQRLVEGAVDWLTYGIFLIAASRLYDPLSTVLINIGAVFNTALHIRRMKDIAQYPIQQGADSYEPKGYDIVFDRVTFAYDEEESVLREVSFTAKQGEVTALVGPSGGGKSTTAKLAARFWDVSGGKITLGGVDIATVDPEVLLQNYAIVFQDVVLFNDTVMENIRLGRQDASDEDVLAAARAARCDTFVKRLPQGYQTFIGENGAALSGGERQRISIARALLKDAPVILLDEATASLDVENETDVQAAISRLMHNKTVLIIAHRMRTVASADKIVVLSGGTVAEVGTPQELWAKGGLYRQMAEVQQLSESF